MLGKEKAMTPNLLANITISKVLLGFTLFLLGATSFNSAQAKACVDADLLNRAADKRKVEAVMFEYALECDDHKTVKTALMALGRIGGQEAADLIQTQLNHKKSDVRKTAAFAAGISLTHDIALELAKQLRQEEEEEVQEELALAIGNLGHEQSAEILYEVINSSKSDAAARGAMQGLGILALFHRDKLTNKQNLDVDKVVEYLANSKTALEASFLLARVPLINSGHLEKVMKIADDLDEDPQAYAIRAIGNLKPKEHFDWLYEKALTDDIGIKVSAIQALGKLPIGDDGQVAKMNQLILSEDTIAALTALQTSAKWMILNDLIKVTGNKNSWLQAQAFNAINDPKPESVQQLAAEWVKAEDPNLQRAAIDFYVKQNNKSTLESFAKSDKEIIANGAKRKLGIYQEQKTNPKETPKELAKLPKKLTLKTTKGDIVIKLYSDTPYTSANFVQLAKEGFYDGTFFHRVIPNFVAQGGSKFGDGSGSVDFSIREELNSRSHRYGTIGMATSGKDTAGGQFFINLAPNLHLDSNYTVFGKVIRGMDVALKLEQNDQIIRIK